MTEKSRRTIWSRIYSAATWALVGYFAFMAIVHVVLTALFYVGAWDTGAGYVLDYEWPAWSIAIMDGVAAYLLWLGHRDGGARPWQSFGLTVVASAIMVARALWFVLVPLLIVVTISGSLLRILKPRS